MDHTPYDDVFRTLLTDCTELIIPVVNEIFHTKYTRKEKICLLQNEHFIKLPDGTACIGKQRTDIQFLNSSFPRFSYCIAQTYKKYT